MKTAKVTIKGISTYQQGRYHQAEKLEKESHDDYEVRTWREKCHTDENGYIFIPGMAFKKALEKAAAFLSEKVPGKSGGKATFTKHFLAGILVIDNMKLDIKKDDVPKTAVFGNSQGKKVRLVHVYQNFSQLSISGEE